MRQPLASNADSAINRRHFMNVCTAFGVGGTLFPGLLWGMTQGTDKKEAAKITKDMVAEAAGIAGVEIKDEYKEMMVDDLNDNAKGYQAIYDLKIPNSVAPAVYFNPVLPQFKINVPAKGPMRMSAVKAIATPRRLEDVAFFTVRQLAELIRTRKVSSTALTQMYLERIKRYDPLLHFVVTLTEDRALAQAKQADLEIAAGKYRGPLHGIPWGAKDLIAVKGYRTTWGAAGYEEQKFEEDATVVQRLDKAGAVLLGKLTLGALAQGDLWFGERTRNPWRPAQGSSGSSAGSSSATAAGCVAFAMGSETLGSISSPSTRVGATGLRPTFGRVPRTGAMALSWSMDKLGPICRSVEDCAIVLDAIHGPDHKDAPVLDYPFTWNAALDIKQLRIGYLKSEFERQSTFTAETKPEAKERTLRERAINKKFEDQALDVLRNKLKLELIPVELPKMPYSEMNVVLRAEAAAAFDDLTRSGRDKLLTGQQRFDWPNTFRIARFIPAVEYVQANRARTLAMEKADDLFRKVDVIVTPTTGTQLRMTNLTGHPAVILPNGFRPTDADAPERPTDGGGPGTPLSLTFLGRLFGEAELLAVAKAYQDATDFHLKYPDLDAALKEAAAAKKPQ
ncbi:MAG TPA: amidase [Terriglobales bacterium]|nr:amidase [Terriglobales bacterium]